MNWQSLRFLADENIDDAVIDFFRKKGFDFSDVNSENLVSASDRAIIERGKQTGRIIITHDTDFGHIVFTEKVPFTGIIYLQPGHIKAEFTIQSLQQLFSSEIELIEPFMIVVEHREDEIKIRVRNSIL
jgi:predicted nuclease of predicted toxin-antitoxin system